MPHQCLKCGRVFEEGSSELLKGCPECGGNRFFFTKQPLDEKERNIIGDKVNNDITSRIMESLSDKHGVSIIPKEIRKILEDKIIKNVEEDARVKMGQGTLEMIDEEQRRSIIEKIESEANRFDSPETIGIERPGRYSIDLKGLLEKEPIIIQKDGAYTIHLPSVFKMTDKKKQ
jgi:hypothetical protein